MLNERGTWPEGIDPDQSTDAMTREPPVFGEARHSVLSPSGQHESERDFTRGLGPRRVKLVIFGFGGLAIMLALLSALQ